MNRKSSLTAFVALLAVAGTALATWTGLAGASPTRQTGSLTGAGSTFVVPLVTQWTSHYHPSQVSYSGIGSGGGIAAITSRTVDFGASDAPLSRDQFSACHGCVQIPWAFSATSIPYNVSGVGYGLKLTGPILASIYLGKITRWNDSRIKAINPGVKLPDEKIVPIYRSDGSGTSYNFTDYLSHISKAWKNKIGKGTQPSFPEGVGARGSSGVAAKLSSTPGGITYIDVAYSLKNKFKIAKLKNRAGKFHLHVGDRAAEDRQGARAEEVHRLGAHEGPIVRAEALVRPASARGQEARPQVGGENPYLARSRQSRRQTQQPALASVRRRSDEIRALRLHS